MLHNLGKEKSNDALILNLYLRGFEKGFFSKQEIFAAISRYLWLSTGKLDFNFDFLFENIKSTDRYQVKYSKEVVKRILSNNEKYGFNNQAFMPEISRFFGIEFVSFSMTIIRHMHQRKTIYNSIRKKVFKN